MNPTDSFRMNSKDVLNHNQSRSDISKSQCVEIWPSILRITATAGIFLYHYLHAADYQTFSLDFYSIIIFCFLSGYFSGSVKGQPEKWLFKKYLGIMIPYWMVIIPILMLNRIMNYKETSIVQDMITFWGGNMFLENPVYVIAWYITFILALYLCNYLFFKTNGPWKIITGIAIIIFFFTIEKSLYFLSYIIGLLFQNVQILQKKRNSMFAIFLFRIQKYCYSFFLIHGIILLFFVTRTSISDELKFFIPLVTTMAMSIILYTISARIIPTLTHLALNWQSKEKKRL